MVWTRSRADALPMQCLDWVDLPCAASLAGTCRWRAEAAAAIRRFQLRFLEDAVLRPVLVAKSLVVLLPSKREAIACLFARGEFPFEAFEAGVVSIPLGTDGFDGQQVQNQHKFREWRAWCGIPISLECIWEGAGRNIQLDMLLSIMRSFGGRRSRLSTKWPDMYEWKYSMSGTRVVNGTRPLLEMREAMEFYVCLFRLHEIMMKMVQREKLKNLDIVTARCLVHDGAVFQKMLLREYFTNIMKAARSANVQPEYVRRMLCRQICQNRDGSMDIVFREVFM